MSGRLFWRQWARILVAAVVGAACSNAGADRVLTIPGVAQVQGFIFFDKDGDSVFGVADTSVTGAKVHLIALGTVDTVNSVTSTAGSLVAGIPVNLKFGAVTAGGYRVAVDTLTIPHDSLRIVRMDSTVSATPGETSYVVIAVSYPAVTTTAARALPLRTKIFVVGVALANANTFGDNTNSFVDASGAIRVTQIKPSTFVSVGDSDRILGTVDTLDGQRVLRVVTVFPTLASSSDTLPVTLTVAQAKTAAGGADDAKLAILSGRVVIHDTTTGPAGRIMHVTDTTASPTDTLEVHLDTAATFDSAAVVRDTVRARVKLRGILLPSSVPGRWLLKPRSPADQS